jgi:hypothetical protein
VVARYGVVKLLSASWKVVLFIGRQRVVDPWRWGGAPPLIAMSGVWGYNMERRLM